MQLWASWPTVEAKAPRSRPNPCTHPRPIAPGGVVTLGHRQPGHVRGRIGRVGDQRSGGERARLDPDGPGPRPAGGQGEVRRPGGHPQVDRARIHAGRRHAGTAPGTADTVHGHQPPGLPHPGRSEAGQPVEGQDVGLLAGARATRVRRSRGTRPAGPWPAPGRRSRAPRPPPPGPRSRSCARPPGGCRAHGRRCTAPRGRCRGGAPSGSGPRRFWLADPWRMKTHMPLRRFSSASSSSVHSWSDSTPAAR